MLNTKRIDIPEKMTVDWLLNNVDLEFDWYTPSEIAIEFMNFIRLVLGEEPENTNPYAHYFLIDTIFGQDSVKPYFEERGISWLEVKGRTAVLCCREFSKALTLGTKIPTPDGFTTMGEIQVGDSVYDRDGVVTKVVSKSGMFLKPTYKMTLEDGRELVMSEDHENIVWTCTDKRLKGAKSQIGGITEKVMTAKELYEKGLFWSRTITDKKKKATEYKYFVPKALNAVDRPDTDYPLDAYTAGVLLGDGNISKDTGFSRVTLHEDNYKDLVKHIPYTVGTVNRSKDGKRVPYKLMIGSYRQRLDVLQGLMDTSGFVNKKGSACFSTVSEGLAKDVQELVWSLGGIAKISERVTDFSFGKSYSVMIQINEKLFRLPYKADRQIFVPARDRIGIVSMELVHTQPTKCITVESDTKSFLAGDYVVTHNSTLIGSFLPLFIAWKGELPGFGKVNYGIYVGDSMRNNVKTTMQTIEEVYLESVWLQSQFEYTKFTDEQIELIRLPRTKKELAVYQATVNAGGKPNEVPNRAKRKFVMKGAGSQTGTRGTRSGLQRPQFAIFDDLLPSEADASSDIILTNIESTIESDVLNALHGGGSFSIIIGTPYNKKDPVYKRVESGAWAPVVFPICKEIRLDMPKEEFVGVWEDRHSYENVMRRYKDAVRDNSTRSFMQELMLRITSEDARLVKDSYINWAKRRDILNRAMSYNWYITTDFTTGGGKGSDLSGCAVWVVSNNDDRILVDIALRKMELVEQYDNTFEFVNKYTRQGQFIEVGVEIDGQQKAHIHALEQLMMKRGEYFSLARQKGESSPGIRARKIKGVKHDRFKLTVPWFQQGKMWICEELKGTPDLEELLEELRFVTVDGFGSKYDDGADLISMLTLMDIRVPSKSREAYIPNNIPAGEEHFYPDLDIHSGNNYVF